MERPAKKPRLHGPDGFQKSKATSRYKPPESITKFVSAFDSPSKPTTPPRKPVSLTTHDRPRNPFVDFDVPREPEAGPSKSSVAKGPSKPTSFARPLCAAKADRVLPPLKVLKPPVFLHPPAEAAPETTNAGPSTKTTSATLRSLQPTLKLPPAPSEKPRSILKPPPVPVQPSTKPSVPLKPLAPPPLPERPTSPKKPMKTIFTTNIAQATDPTKEGTGAELLSLFLQQHGHGFTSSTDRELQRGVMVSPDKRSRGKDPKFVRYVVLSLAPLDLISDLLSQRWPGGTLSTSHHVRKNRLCAVETPDGTKDRIWGQVWVGHAAARHEGARRGQGV